MPLHIRIDNVENNDELMVDVPMEYGGGRDLDGVTKTLGFASMSYGIPKITKENADEVFRRVQVMEEAIGPLMYGPNGVDVLFTMKDIERRIGMTTNVTPFSKTKFAALIKRHKEQEARRGV